MENPTLKITNENRNNVVFENFRLSGKMNTTYKTGAETHEVDVTVLLDNPTEEFTAWVWDRLFASLKVSINSALKSRAVGPSSYSKLLDQLDYKVEIDGNELFKPAGREVPEEVKAAKAIQTLVDIGKLTQEEADAIMAAQ